jgi:hypothetical protein
VAVADATTAVHASGSTVGSDVTAVLSDVAKLNAHLEVGVCLHAPAQIGPYPHSPPGFTIVQCSNCGQRFIQGTTYTPRVITRYIA